MNALQLVTVPKLTLMLRKNYGQAYINMGGNRNADDVAAWPTAEVSFMDPTFAVNVVHGSEGKRLEQENPALFQEKFDEMQRNSTAWDLGACYAVQQVIRPEERRDDRKRVVTGRRGTLSVRREGGRNNKKKIENKNHL